MVATTSGSWVTGRSPRSETDDSVVRPTPPCLESGWDVSADILAPMPELVIETTELNDSWVSMAVQGEIDLATVHELDEAIDAVFSDESSSLVVDLNNSSFMDSTGLKSLVMAHRRFADEDRELAIAVDGGPISRLIDLSGVDSSIRVVPKAPDALRGVERQS